VGKTNARTALPILIEVEDEDGATSILRARFDKGGYCAQFKVTESVQKGTSASSLTVYLSRLP